MSAIDRLLSCRGNPVEFFELVEAARIEVERLRADSVLLKDGLRHYANPEVWHGEGRDVYEDYDGYAVAQRILKKVEGDER